MIISVLLAVACVIFIFGLMPFTRRYRQAVSTIIVEAPIENVWEIVLARPSPHGGPRLLSTYNATDDPDVVEGYWGKDGARSWKRVRHFPTDEHYAQATRDESVHWWWCKGPIAYPFGDESVEITKLEPADGGGTQVMYISYMSQPLLAHLEQRWRVAGLYLRDVRNKAENRPKPRPLIAGLSLWTVGSSLLALLAACWQFGWVEGLALSFMIVLHEIGHAIGFLLVGERVCAIRLIPFFGGITVGTPPKTAMRDAIVSLSGAAFSLLFALLLLALPTILDLPVIMSWNGGRDYDGISAGGVFVIAACAILLLNLIQLLPLGILDGGKTLQAALSGLPGALPIQLVAIIGLLIAVGLYMLGATFQAFLAGFFSLLVLTQLFDPTKGRTYTAATVRSGVLIGGLYALHLVAYCGTIIAVALTFFYGGAVASAREVDFRDYELRAAGIEELDAKIGPVWFRASSRALFDAVVGEDLVLKL